MSTTEQMIVSTTEYLTVAEGSASVLVQAVGNGTFQVIVADAQPAANKPGIVIDQLAGFVWSGNGLASTDNVYVRALNANRTSVTVMAS